MQYTLKHFRHDSFITVDAMREMADPELPGVSTTVNWEAYRGHRIEHTFTASSDVKANEIVCDILSRTPFLVYRHELSAKMEQTA